MAQLKPVSKLIIIAIAVGSIGYGINVAMHSGAIKVPTPTVAVPQSEASAATVQTTEPASAPLDITPTQPNPAANAGLAKLLQSTK